MHNAIPKISVYMITYNQENVIDRTIASLLKQKDYIYEICISDDHSIDNTWTILENYKLKYPDLFKIHQNTSNLGIFENTEYVWTMPSGDLVYDLAGDDCVGDNWFKTIINFIEDNKIDYKNELFCIYGDYQCIYPNMDSITHRNNSIAVNSNALKLALRGLLCNRSACYSINILKKFKKCSKGRSHIAEEAQDRQLQLFTTKNYYISSVGNIYYSLIGVSSRIDDKIFEERQLIRPYAISFLKDQGASLDSKDMMYSLVYLPIYNKLKYKFKILLGVKVILYYLLSFDFTIHSPVFNFKQFAFSVIRRLPHKKAITM